VAGTVVLIMLMWRAYSLTVARQAAAAAETEGLSAEAKARLKKKKRNWTSRGLGWGVQHIKVAIIDDDPDEVGAPSNI
jgi:hypothetical protein